MKTIAYIFLWLGYVTVALCSTVHSAANICNEGIHILVCLILYFIYIGVNHLWTQKYIECKVIVQFELLLLLALGTIIIGTGVGQGNFNFSACIR